MEYEESNNSQKMKGAPNKITVSLPPNKSCPDTIKARISVGIGPFNVTTCALTNKQTKTEDLCH